jgi:hypothetical protein
LAAPGVVSPRVRTLGSSPSHPHPQPSRLTGWTARCRESPDGGKGAACLRGQLRPELPEKRAGNP